VDLDLSGRRALITGASKGIGLAVARRLASEGADVAICARGEAHLNEAADQLRSGNTQVYPAICDAGDADALRGFVADAASTLGGLDIVVHNTSASVGRSLSQWQASFDLDLMPFVHLVDAAQPYLDSSDAAAVVAIGTAQAVETAPQAAANSYGAFKAAIIQHASALAHTLAAKRIRVNTVSPGPVWFTGGVWDNIRINSPQVYDSLVAQIPLGSMPTDDEIANAVAFLASPVAGHITGVNLVVDGGFTRRVQY
jgi:NAD(P)-dependent dehydrogenase (short-subunit alcohol dehydrogenase family)